MSLPALQGRPDEDKKKSTSNLILLSNCPNLVRDCSGVRDCKLGTNCHAYGTNVNGQ
jgi:hypothetical protein